MKCVIFDTGTTGLTLPIVSSIDMQPRIIEIGLIIVEDGKITSTYEQLIKPCNIKITPKITRITGIKDKDIADKPFFEDIYKTVMLKISDCDYLIAHNANFDSSMINFELMRIGHDEECISTDRLICTAQEYAPLFGKRPTLKALYERIMCKRLSQTHRALDDVMALWEIIQNDNFLEQIGV